LILDKISKLDFSFKTPKTLLLKNGKTYFTLMNGTQATVFHLINGHLPTNNLSLSLIEKIGLAAGELNTKMSNIEISKEEIFLCNTFPYYDLWKVHSQIMYPEKFFNLVKSDLFHENNYQKEKGIYFPNLREDTDFLMSEISMVMNKIKTYIDNKKEFPHQLIHGDLHHENILCLVENEKIEEQKITAILDFEFVAWDLRAMEIAICLSKFASEINPLEFFEAFIKGYSQTSKLNESELNIIKDLILLRIISNFVYFVGRYLGKEEPLELCLKKVGVYAKRVKWLKENNDNIKNLLFNYFK